MNNTDDIQIEDLDKEIIEKETKKSGNILNNKKLWMAVITALVIIALIVVVIIIASQGDRQSAQNETVGEVIPVEPEGTGASEPEEINELLLDAYPEVNNLMKTYFNAKLNCDLETLLKIVSDTETISEEKLQKENEYIEDYQNIKCYTKNGILEGTYIVYVYFEYKFYNIDTTAPAMIRMYVCTNEAGDVYIYNETVDGEIASYMEEINNSEDVVDLFAETDSRLKVAIESDENLMGFYTKLVEGVGADTESSAEETSAAEVTTETAAEVQTEVATESTSDQLKEVDDTAYVKENTGVYSEPAADDQHKVAAVSGGERYRRTGYNDQWSRIEYSDGAFGYVSNDKLVIDENFIYVNEKVYAKQTVRVRAEASYDAEVVGTLYEGEAVKRLGYNDEWSKVVFEGEIYYIGKGFLTAARPED